METRVPYKALTFDVFGTVVDWRGSIIRQGEALGRAKGLRVDWAKFADAWRAGYGPAMDRVRRKEMPWTTIDKLHRMILNNLVSQFGLNSLSEAELDELNRVWHRLNAWPDSVAGLTRLKKRFVIATLSNGNVSLLVNMAKFAGLPWDTVLSAELAGHYKPDREAYLKAVEFLDCRPEEVLMVAAHKSDLQGARAAGLKTAYVVRREESGPAADRDVAREAWMDHYATDFLDLARQLGA